MTKNATTRVSAALAGHAAAALGRALPDEVAEKTRHHLLDTLAAVVSGARMVPGRAGLAYVRTQGGRREASVLAARHRTSAVYAALANGMAAHADETDDSHQFSLTHPGCGVVPAALAMAEREGATGTALLRAVALGYEATARTGIALGAYRFTATGHDSHSYAVTIGAAACAAALARLPADRLAVALSYGVQQAAGLSTLFRDPEHVEKAFVFAGMPARNGVAAATMAQSGMTGVPDPFDDDPGFFAILSVNPDAEAAFADLGTRYEIMRTNIKRWSVGSPAQAVLDSLEALIREHGVTADDVEEIVVHLSNRSAQVVNAREMPDINAQYLAAVMLIDGTVSFAASHDFSRMNDPRIRALRERIKLVPNEEMQAAEPTRQAIVDIMRKDGQRLSHRTTAVRGTFENPMTREEVVAKARDLMAPVLGRERAQAVIDAVWSLERIDDVTALVEPMRV